MRLEFSAGGIVVKNISQIQDKNEFLTLVCQHSGHHGWGFPKGHIGDNIPGETRQQAAIREVREETGINAEILYSLSPVTYWYEFEKEKRKKTVYYFLMNYIGGDITEHDFEMESVEWIASEDVMDRLTFPSDKKVWTEVKKKIINNFKR